MKRMRVSAVLLMLVLAVVLFSGCSSEEKSDAAEPKYRIGICQMTRHDALDEATQGFVDKLTELLGEENISFDNQNAQGDLSICTNIVTGFVANNVDLILANNTAALQVASSATDTIPILGTSITDYAYALGLNEWNGMIGGNISGTSDLAPLEDQAKMIQELFPDARHVGLLYCAAEPNSVYQIETVEAELKTMGYQCTKFAYTDSNDAALVAQEACDASEVIYIPTDNTAADNTELFANVVLPARVPVVGGDAEICGSCGVATLYISYYDLGVETAEMAYEILVEGADISSMAIRYAESSSKQYNAENCDLLGVSVPDDYTPLK